MYICLLGVIIYKSQILLIEKKYNVDNYRYILPGGHWDFPESFKSGVEREVFEETGVKVKAEKLIKVSINLLQNRLEFYFTCKLIGTENLKLQPTYFDHENNDQHFKPMFVAKKELSNKYFKTPSTKDIISEFINSPN